MKKILLFSVFLLAATFTAPVANAIFPSGGDVAGDWIDKAKNVIPGSKETNERIEKEGRGGNALDKKSVLSGPGFRGGHRIVRHKIDSGISKEKNIKNLIIGWMNVLLSLSALLATVAIVWAGTLYVTATGDDSAHEKAKKIIIYVAIGIILTLGSYAIVNTIMQARLGV